MALIVALVVEIVLFVAVQGDMISSDPLWYASIAHRIAVDWHEAFAHVSTHPFDMRVGLTVPLAGLYRLFGVSMVVTNLPCLAAALVILVVIYKAAPTPRAQRIGLLLGVCSSTLVRQITLVTVDLPTAALVACATLWLSWRDREHGARWLAAAMVAWFAAFLVKETALWMIPVWIYAIVVDVRAIGVRRTARTFAPAIAVGAALSAGYMVLCAHVWGSALARFSSVEDLTGTHAWSMTHSAASAWLKRLTWGPTAMFFRLFGAVLVPALIAPWVVRGRERIWWVAAVAFVGLFWFGSSSLRAYDPLPLFDRMVMPAFAPLLVLAACTADAVIDRLGRARRWVVAASLLAVIVPNALAIGLEIARRRPETAAFARLRREAADPTHPLVVVTSDVRGVATGDFYFGFERPANLQIVFAPDFATAALPARATVRALVSLSRRKTAEKMDPRGDRIDAIEALHLPALLRDRYTRLYDAGDGVRLHDALRAAEH